jgi:hypothetical protein
LSPWERVVDTGDGWCLAFPCWSCCPWPSPPAARQWHRLLTLVATGLLLLLLAGRVDRTRVKQLAASNWLTVTVESRRGGEEEAHGNRRPISKHFLKLARRVQQKGEPIRGATGWGLGGCEMDLVGEKKKKHPPAMRRPTAGRKWLPPPGFVVVLSVAWERGDCWGEGQQEKGEKSISWRLLAEEGTKMGRALHLSAVVASFSVHISHF